MAVNIGHLAVLGLCIWGISGEKIRPCQNPSQNYKCVGEYLNKYSNCSRELNGDNNMDPRYVPYIVKRSTPFLNYTETRTNATSLGASQAYVKDFFYNDLSRKAVLTVFYPYLRITGLTKFHFQVPEDEGFSVTTSYDVTYTDVTLTTVFDDYTDMSLENSETSPYIPSLPKVILGNELADAAKTNKQVAKVLAGRAEYDNVVTLETFAARSVPLLKNFVNYKLCNYG